MYQRLKQIYLFKSKLVKMNFYQVQNTLCPLERDAAINMHIYSLTPYSNKACHLFIFSLYAVRRTHIDFSTVTFIYGIFVSMKSFKMIISILYCLKFFTFTCTLFCPLWSGEKNIWKEWKNRFANACTWTLRRDLAVSLWCGPGPLFLR